MEKCYYLWGAGGIGKRAIAFLVNFAPFSGIIDSDVLKQGTALHGLPIYSYEEAKPFLGECLVVIAHFSPKSTEDVLNRDGFKSMRLDEFINYWFWKQHQQNAIGFLDFPITIRCTLNCRDCMQRVPLRENFDISVETLVKDLDSLFSNVAFVGEMSIMGGEPFIHNHLYELLDYIVRNYIKKIGSLVITTNGTIVPEKQVLELCRDNDIFISISDYSKTLPKITAYLERFEAIAKEVGVGNERKRWHWSEIGKFDEEYGQNDCSIEHMQLFNGKLWRCTLMAAGFYARLCDAVESIDYHILRNDNKGLHDFLDGRRPTTQCHMCRYPLEIGIDSAIQMNRS